MLTNFCGEHSVICVRGCLRAWQSLSNEMTFDLHIWRARSSWHFLGQGHESKFTFTGLKNVFFSNGCSLWGETSRPWLKSKPEFETVNKYSSQLVGWLSSYVNNEGFLVGHRVGCCLRSDARRQHVQLVKDRRLFDQRIAKLKEDCERMMMAKFGRIVELEELETITVNQQVEEVKDQLSTAEEEGAVDLQTWQVKPTKPLAYLPYRWASRSISHLSHGQCDLRLPSQQKGITALWPVSVYTSCWDSHVCAELAENCHLKAEWPGVKPATSAWRVQLSNCYTTRQWCVVTGTDIIACKTGWPKNKSSPPPPWEVSFSVGRSGPRLLRRSCRLR